MIFLKKDLIILLVLYSLSEKMVHSDKKPHGCSRSFNCFTCLGTDRKISRSQSGEEIIVLLGSKRYGNIYNIAMYLGLYLLN